MSKLVVLDRDGVINNDSVSHIRSPEEWIPLHGSLEAIARLNHSGFKVVVATNQSGIGRGYFSLEQLNAIHQKMRQALDRVGGQLDGIFFCPHTPDYKCNCRKPLPGLLLEIRDRFGVDIRRIISIGDSLRDLQSAWAVEAKGLLVKTGNGLHTLMRHGNELGETQVFADLAAAAEHLITISRQELYRDNQA